jgi:integrase
MKNIEDALNKLKATSWGRDEYGEGYCRAVHEMLGKDIRMPLSEVDQDWVNNLIRRVSQTSTPATTNRKMALISKVLSTGRVLGIRIPKLHVQETARRSFTHEELSRVTDWFRANAPRTAWAYYRILKDTGARPGWEAEHATYEAPNTCVLRSRKGGNGCLWRTVPLPFGYTEADFSDLRVYSRAFNKSWKKMRTVLFGSDPTIVPYVLRHTYARTLLSKGISIHVVARMMGHSSIQTTLQYLHVQPNDIEDVRAAISDI